MIKKLNYLTLTIFAVLITVKGFSQSNSVNASALGGGSVNTITTAVPFLLIAPDSRAGAMGDAGVSTSPDANSIHWNPAKLAFVENEAGLSISYTPWLRSLVPDISLSYLSGYKRLNKLSTIGGSLRYFSLGNIQFTDINGNNTISVNPNEFALDVAYSRLLGDNFSGGIALRVINSSLTAGQNVGGTSTKPGRAVAVDVSAYYENKDIKIKGKDAVFAAGINISNIGNKMSYSNSAKRDFIPINLRLGPRLTIDIDEYNSFTITADINKLLVPTPPLYAIDSTGQPIKQNGQLVILSGSDPNRAVASGIFGSFSDAPGIPLADANGNILLNPDGTAQVQGGSKFREELKEFNFSLGMEYWYGKQLAIRAGYFYEPQSKGNRKFISLGAGVRYSVFGLNLSYLIPAYFNSNSVQKSPLANTLRFSLVFNFSKSKDAAAILN